MKSATMSRNNILHVFALVCGLILSGVGAHAADKGGPTIKKCQDATGKWYYGDTAAAECAKSKITVMSEEGATKKVIAAPPTEKELKELKERKEIEAAEHKQAEEQAKKDALLLSTYGVEDDIIYIRDRKISQIEASVRASEETLKSLRAALARMEAQAAADGKGDKAGSDQDTLKSIEQTKAQIARHEASVAAKRQEQEALRKQYAGELERYRELKKSPPAMPAAPAKKPQE